MKTVSVRLQMHSSELPAGGQAGYNVAGACAAAGTEPQAVKYARKRILLSLRLHKVTQFSRRQG